MKLSRESRLSFFLPFFAYTKVMNFWSTHKIAGALNLPLPSKDVSISQITTDSRAIAPGCLFVAVKGDTHDGHDFISQAIEKGAAAILTEKSPPSTPSESIHFFHVPSTMTAIRTLAHAYRKSFSIPVIGIVGAVGKTTTKEFIAATLHGKFTKVLKTEGSQNGFLGIPLTLLKLEPTTEVAVIEIGIDEIGAMDQHLQLVEPTHLILTTIGPEHLHQLKTVEIAAEEELRAFDYGLIHRSMMAINLSDPYVQQWYQKNKLKVDPSITKTYQINTPSPYTSFTNPLEGDHNAINLLAALTLCSFFGMTAQEMKLGLSTFKTAYGRSEIYRIGNQIVIGDYYNSNPTSAAAALKLLSQMKLENGHSKLHAILGDMLELGDHEEKYHRELSESILSHSIDQVWLYGPRMKWLEDELKKKNYHTVQHFQDHDSLNLALSKNIQKSDRVLVKGSRGMKMEKVLKPLIEPTSAGSGP